MKFLGHSETLYASERDEDGEAVRGSVLYEGPAGVGLWSADPADPVLQYVVNPNSVRPKDYMFWLERIAFFAEPAGVEIAPAGRRYGISVRAHIKDADALVRIELDYARVFRLRITRCLYCKRWFIATGRRPRAKKYCPVHEPSGRNLVYRRRLFSEHRYARRLQRERAYKAMYEKVRRGTMTRKSFEEWKRENEYMPRSTKRRKIGGASQLVVPKLPTARARTEGRD